MAGAAAHPRLSVAVLTKNEAHRIRECLRSAAWADEVVVVDSGSTDATVAIALGEGAQVHIYPDWQGFAVQRNRQLRHVSGDYVFFLDADEVMSEAFSQELRDIVNRNEPGVWQIRWRMWAFGHELKYYRSSTTVERLFRRDMLLRFEGAVHEEAVLSAPETPRYIIRERLAHHSRETVRGSLDKLTQYAMLGAAKRAEPGRRGGVCRGLASALAMFIRLYFLKLAFLCGGPGFLYSLFVALESFFRYAALYYDREHLTERIER